VRALEETEEEEQKPMLTALDAISDLDLNMNQKTGIIRLVDLVRGGVALLNQAEASGFRAAVEEVLSEFAESGARDPDPELGTVSWAVLWFFADIAKTVGYDWREHKWDKEPSTCCVDPDGVTKLDRVALIRGLASALADEEVATTLLMARFDGKMGTLTSLNAVYRTGVLIDELRKVDPYLQVVGPGCTSFWEKYLDGANLDDLPVVETLQRTLKRALRGRSGE
jgi:hypothetical protein